MYSLNLAEDKRILSACNMLAGFEYQNVVLELPEGNIIDYKYIDGGYVYDPLPNTDPEEQPSQLDLIEAQVTYTAMMTDTLPLARPIYPCVKDIVPSALNTIVLSPN